MRKIRDKMTRLLNRVKDSRSRSVRRSSPQPTFRSIDELADWHFSTWSSSDHINRTGLTVALRRLKEQPALIVETGTSAWGTDSTRLWAAYVNSFGGHLWSVDIRAEPSKRLGNLGGSVHFAVQDSVEFLRGFALPQGFDKISLAYLDSYDLDPRNPEPAMSHGLEEWLALQPLLGDGSVVVIDDTPVEAFLLGQEAQDFCQRTTQVPGKGAHVLSDVLQNRTFRIAYHHYNLVLVREMLSGPGQVST